MDSPERLYTMRISRMTVEKLGIKLYDRVSAVLAELIANAYDADAQNVTILLPFDTYLAYKRNGAVIDNGFEIEIRDDGHGMTYDEVNAFYLAVGENRRAKRGDVSLRGRPVMGRKGIGKLSPFGICREIEIVSAGQADWDTPPPFSVANLVLRLDDILNEDDEASDYHPKQGSMDGQFVDWRGTRIILRDFERRRVPAADDLMRQLAARFGIQRSDWAVELIDRRSDTREVLGGMEIDLLPGTLTDVSNSPVRMEDDSILPVSGWIGYSAKSYRDDAMAGVRIFARGKIVAQTRDFDIRSGFTGEYKMRSYIVGQVTADWLDDEEDLVRSDRQDIIWNSDQGQALQEWGRQLIKDLAARAETTVGNSVWQEFSTATGLDERLKQTAPKDGAMRDSIRQAARLFVNRADRDAIANDPDFRERIIDLAYSVGPQRELLETLRSVAETETNSFAVVAGLFRKARIVEIYSLGQVAAERVDAVDTLEALIGNAETLERELQDLIENAPWIINPTWTPLSMNNSLANVRRLFESWYRTNFGREISTTTIDRPTKQPDFVLLSFEGTLEIVEIKRPDHALTDEEFDRAFGYLEALEKFLTENSDIGKGFRGVTLTIVCDHNGLSSVYRNSAARDNRIVWKKWHEVLQGTLMAHQDFVDKVREMQGRVLSANSTKALGDSLG